MKNRILQKLILSIAAVIIWGSGPAQITGYASNTNNPTFLNGSWQQDEKGWRFAQNYGNTPYPANQWGKLNERRYYFDEEGYAVTGWLSIDDSWYYFNPEPGRGYGVMLTGWLKDNQYGGWFYFNHLGIMVTGWHKIDGDWYYFHTGPDRTKGIMASDQLIDDYYLDHTGRMNDSRS